MACQYVPASERFASGLFAYLDCQAATLGAQGYGALATPGSPVSVLLLALLTIFIALTGYRMLLGDTPTLREGVLAFVKIGTVLALATSWPAYQVLIYDVALRAPGELAAGIGGASGLPGTTGDLAARLDAVDQGFRTLSIYGVGVPVTDPNVGGLSPVEPQLWAGFDTFALGASRIVFIAAAAASFGLARLAAGFLLALGPLFIAFLLFAGTRGLFEGWLRALIGAALGALVATIALSVELALLEPWLANLVVRRAGNEAITGVPATLLAATLVFAAMLAGILFVAARVGAGLRLPHGAVSQNRAPGREPSLPARSPSMLPAALAEGTQAPGSRSLR
jgi:type IV secretion system protein VirB6